MQSESQTSKGSGINQNTKLSSNDLHLQSLFLQLSNNGHIPANMPWWAHSGQLWVNCETFWTITPHRLQVDVPTKEQQQLLPFGGPLGLPTETQVGPMQASQYVNGNDHSFALLRVAPEPTVALPLRTNITIFCGKPTQKAHTRATMGKTAMGLCRHK